MRIRTVSSPEVHLLVDELFSSELHAKRVLSLSNATVGVIQAGTLAIRAIGHGLALAKQLKWKHTIKQVDRLIGSPAVDPWELAARWVPFVIGARTEVAVALDWTDFDTDVLALPPGLHVLRGTSRHACRMGWAAHRQLRRTAETGACLQPVVHREMRVSCS
jgi:hypothetical protein